MKNKIYCITVVWISLLLPPPFNLFAMDGDNSQGSPPNIIFIMTDDHSKQAISSYGSKINQTPNIDRIASEGIRFDRCFVTNSICAPSRAVALTGKYSHINGLKDNRDSFDGTQMTFPRLLQKAGYQTALIGKWHLKSTPTGFDYWKILPGQGDYYNPRFIEMGDTVKHTGYVTNLITDFAIQTLQHLDKDKPFCLLYFHKAPHRNWMPDLKHLTMYDDIEIPIPETFFDDYQTRSAAAREQDMKVLNLFNSLDMKIHPGEISIEYSGGHQGYDAQSAWKQLFNSLTDEQRQAWNAAYEPKNRVFLEANLTGEELAKWKYQRYIKDYLRCVASVDENIGRLLEYLDKEALAKNTIIIYTSDQGFYLGEHGWYDKRFMYEESFSTPLIIRYPKEIPAGALSKDLVLNLDLCSTILNYAGVEIPAGVQGESLQPLAKGETPAQWRRSIYYHYYEYPHGWHQVKKHYGIRTAKYKLIHFYHDIDAWELYDLEKDPKELNNVFGHADYLDIQNSLAAELTKLRKHYREAE